MSNENDDDVIQIAMKGDISPEFVQRSLSPSFSEERTPKKPIKGVRTRKSKSPEQGGVSSGPLLPRKCITF